MTHDEEKHSTEAFLDEPEPWESWETHLVGWSLAIAIIGLFLLGWFINSFILS